jgi:hypothetical protein
MEQLQLFEDDEMLPTRKLPKKKSRKEIYEDYDAFVAKFDKNKEKTTDDCYTPQPVYEAVLEWLRGEVDLEGKEIMRPFYPGGDYQSEDYHEDCVVVDNPPFSILAEIITFYIVKGVKFFLFAPAQGLTSASISGRKDIDVTYIMCAVIVKYHNGAVINTAFVSNLFGNLRLWCCHKLHIAVKNANEQKKEKKTKQQKIIYPDNVLTTPNMRKIARWTDLKIIKEDCYQISQLQSQKKWDMNIFGKGFLLSARATAEKEAAERRIDEKRAAQEEAEEAEAIVLELSESEKQIIKQLGKKNENNV